MGYFEIVSNMKKPSFFSAFGICLSKSKLKYLTIKITSYLFFGMIYPSRSRQMAFIRISFIFEIPISLMSINVTS